MSGLYKEVKDRFPIDMPGFRAAFGELIQDYFDGNNVEEFNLPRRGGNVIKRFINLAKDPNKGLEIDTNYGTKDEWGRALLTQEDDVKRLLSQLKEMFDYCHEIYPDYDKYPNFNGFIEEALNKADNDMNKLQPPGEQMKPVEEAKEVIKEVVDQEPPKKTDNPMDQMVEFLFEVNQEPNPWNFTDDSEDVENEVREEKEEKEERPAQIINEIVNQEPQQQDGGVPFLNQNDVFYSNQMSGMNGFGIPQKKQILGLILMKFHHLILSLKDL